MVINIYHRRQLGLTPDSRASCVVCALFHSQPCWGLQDVQNFVINPTLLGVPGLTVISRAEMILAASLAPVSLLSSPKSAPFWGQAPCTSEVGWESLVDPHGHRPPLFPSASRLSTTWPQFTFLASSSVSAHVCPGLLSR